jgi:hypothetical protein
MADEAFALSPISARAAQPSEGDYDAIREAFMETSRGRWFLGEYAKRNRNADTTMVLDAVARIEETLAASRKPSRDPLFDEALASLRTALEQAREAAGTAMGELALEENLAPVRKGARVIREIAWRLREIGADGRICDLIDSQVGAIEGAAARLSQADLAAAVSGAFDRIEAKIAAFDADDAASDLPKGEASPPETSEAPPEASETMETASAASETATAEPVVVSEAAITASEEAAIEPADAFDANDEALLNMVALEMSAPDSDADYDPPADAPLESEASYELDVSFAPRESEERSEAKPSGIKTSEAEPSDPETSEAETSAPEQPVVAAAPPAITPLQPVPEPEPASELKSEPAPAPEPSLGSSLLANGIVSRPRTSKPDPLAPIRRMSQTEKIAFFS